ncbi:MAG TPA: hypothetical protein VF453_19470 [Burkholderiaceae bacterium]
MEPRRLRTIVAWVCTVGGMLAAASYALFPLTVGGTLGQGVGMLLVGLVLVLPALLLAAVVAVFHLRGEPDDWDPPTLIPPAAPPAP